MMFNEHAQIVFWMMKISVDYPELAISLKSEKKAPEKIKFRVDLCSELANEFFKSKLRQFSNDLL